MNPICTIRTPNELRETIKAKAKDKGISMNALVLQILWEWARKEEGRART